jgi:hypothetical protein
MTWEGDHQGLAAAIGAKAPEFIYIPTNVLVQLAPQEAYLSEVNFSYNNLFDNSAAREDLGFWVTIPWVEGARRTVKWLEDNGKLEKSEDFPLYDQIIEAWQKAVRNLTEAFNQ